MREGWGELGFFVPERALNDGYPCEVELTLPDGGRRRLLLSSERYPLPQISNFKMLLFRSERGEWGMEFEGFRFRGAHGLFLQDFRDRKWGRGRYRIVLSFSAESGFEADLTIRIWARLRR